MWHIECSLRGSSGQTDVGEPLAQLCQTCGWSRETGWGRYASSSNYLKQEFDVAFIHPSSNEDVDLAALNLRNGVMLAFSKASKATKVGYWVKHEKPLLKKCRRTSKQIQPFQGWCINEDSDGESILLQGKMRVTLNCFRLQRQFQLVEWEREWTPPGTLDLFEVVSYGFTFLFALTESSQISLLPARHRV